MSGSDSEMFLRGPALSTTQPMVDDVPPGI
jgi:hypothetical protein